MEFTTTPLAAFLAVVAVVAVLGASLLAPMAGQAL